MGVVTIVFAGLAVLAQGNVGTEGTEVLLLKANPEFAGVHLPRLVVPLNDVDLYKTDRAIFVDTIVGEDGAPRGVVNLENVHIVLENAGWGGSLVAGNVSDVPPVTYGGNTKVAVRDEVTCNISLDRGAISESAAGEKWIMKADSAPSDPSAVALSEGVKWASPESGGVTVITLQRPGSNTQPKITFKAGVSTQLGISNLPEDPHDSMDQMGKKRDHFMAYYDLLNTPTPIPPADRPYPHAVPLPKSNRGGGTVKCFMGVMTK
jgi:hypothetical protein